MEQEVEQYLNDDILLQAATSFQIPFTSLKKLGSFENYVFEGINSHGEEVILRLTHSSHRTKEQVEAELHWLSYLHNNNAPVSGCLPSINGNLVETVQSEDTSFFVSLFEKAIGRPVKVTESLFNETLFYKWGKTIGRFHRLTVNYTRPDFITKRPDLVEEYDKQFAPFLPKGQKLLSKVNEVLQAVKQLPKSSIRYGLIHSDVHSGNFFYDEATDKMTVFDFDDCSYHHFISDIAIPLYYSTWLKCDNQQDRNHFGHEFLMHFLKGYQTERSVHLESLKEISLFLKLRDCELYGVFHKKWDLDHLNDQQKKLLNGIYLRIMNDQPLVQLNLEKIIHSL
ncbi:phosphotransferase enzyme family protein [Alkalihalobacterium chitinilyticum]|uniref:Phosphotransferase n=1 Tax=Alkalihalobacterium chitinilyticum TaxID=2980103 RepID=A0ABT5VCK7_9BACI|nr:phosphotransferase [Alkalihalobacterium chitinilyticum]MDE5413178.1 phosphotransferase [Alkalihalobacterium chitinilyticum]